MRRFVSICVCAVALCACNEPAPKREWQPSDHGQPSAQPESSEESPETVEDPAQANARAARALFVAACSSCHGRDGRGQGEARPPGANLPDFTATAWQQSRTDTQLLQTIRDGRGMMPPFGKRVNDQGLAVLVRYVRSFEGDRSTKQPSSPEAASSP